MDPRHPEQAIDRIDQLINQFKTTIDNIRTVTVSSKLGQLEREGGLIVQEICLVAPRLHEAMTQVSRQRRHNLSRGFFPEVAAENLEHPTSEAIETYVAPNQAETVIVEPNYKKKTTRKKKTVKKKEDK